MLALASVILALGAGPLLPETTFRATAEASATAMANPRRRSRALRCSGAGGWPVGLPETIFRATAKASATASLALASVVLALGAGPSGFPKQFSRQPPSRSLPSFWRWGVETSDESGGILDGQWPQWPFYQPEADKWPDLEIRAADGRFHIVPYKEFISGQIKDQSRGRVARARFRNFGAGSLPVPNQLSGRRPKLPRQPWQTRAVARARSVFLALGAGPSGFPKNFPGDGRSFCDSLPRARFRRSGAGGWPVAAMAVLSTRSGQMARSLNSGCGWPISYCPV